MSYSEECNFTYHYLTLQTLVSNFIKPKKTHPLSRHILCFLARQFSVAAENRININVSSRVIVMFVMLACSSQNTTWKTDQFTVVLSLHDPEPTMSDALSVTFSWQIYTNPQSCKIAEREVTTKRREMSLFSQT